MAETVYERDVGRRTLKVEIERYSNGGGVVEAFIEGPRGGRTLLSHTGTRKRATADAQWYSDIGRAIAEARDRVWPEEGS